MSILKYNTQSLYLHSSSQRLGTSMSTMLKNTVSTHILVLGLIALMGLFSCAEPIEDINLVQPNYIKKSKLTGTWYHQQTMVDVSPEVSLGFTGYEAALEKIRWEITENFLYAYRIYEPVPKLRYKLCLGSGIRFRVICHIWFYGRLHLLFPYLRTTSFFT